MFDFLWNLGAFIVALGILITAHEYGHFWVARRCGVKVERFSIGFGKAIWRRLGKDGTEYVIAMIPLGGYVKMLDERVEDVPEELKDQAFNRKSVWARIAIVAAGPIANFIFAIFALYIMYLIGVPSLKPVISDVRPGSPAAVMQIDGPQQIVAVSGQKVRNWEEVNLALVGHIGDDSMSLTLRPLNQASQPDDGLEPSGRTYQLDIRNWRFDPEKESPFSTLGLDIFRPDVIPEVETVTDGGAAAKAGVKAGDILVAVNGEAYSDWQTFVGQIKVSAGKPLQLTVKRGGEQQTFTLIPDSRKGANGEMEGVIGLAPKAPKWPDNMLLDLQYGPLESISVAADKTWQLVVVSFKMIAKLFTGDVSVKNLSGPISIAQGAGNSANIGLVYFLGFLALISVNLGIINLLPLPVLDGGHLMYYLVEVITGKPVSERVQEIGFRFGAALLLMLMSIALFNDFARL
ncbi:sigma E protease regulator RseP [Shewanella algae]|uniref:sigma E protease regulator RseP n=1 Tax=Shewanella algae TaxID=38313 RepID=UPI000D116FEB|nr:sigma E protease regulator RseP [Shewanella algae]EKT4489526.1 sigma E protease regulator RseP [Shewanella algae]MBO2548745.1 sigma E protease regulator RseP [Shewanella algae]PSS66208.1 zinc metallopeptidase RseP [Shewanella algae]TVL07529.1 zinc metallopeptidase RseP [Shewanella algae]